MFKDNYLPADAPASVTLNPITNPQQILQTIEADAQKEDTPTKPEHPSPAEHNNDHYDAEKKDHPQADGIAALSYLLRFLTPHIERMVEKKFAALVQSHNTLTHMDANLEDKMRAIAADAIEQHELDKEHPDEDDVTSRVEDTIETYLRRNHGFVTEDRVNDIVSEAIEQHENDANHIDEWEIERKLEDFISTDNIEEYVVEALKNVEFKINVTEKE